MAVHIDSGQEVAIKIIKNASLGNSERLKKIKQEAKILAAFTHPHIMRVYELIESPDDIYIVMEYIPGGELYDSILSRGKYEEDEARALFQQLIYALEYCHAHGVVHRDIKPENILLDDHGDVKIIDFGLANYFKDGSFLSTSCGSVNYAAPEILEGEPYSGPEVDIWSAGIVLYILLSGYLPFDDNNLSVLFAKIKNAEYELPPMISEESADLIARMLNPDPVNRISLGQILKHPWFNINISNHLTCQINFLEPENKLISLTDMKLKSSHNVDEEIFNRCRANPKLVQKSVDEETLKKRLQKRKQDAFCVCYRMLSDAKRKEKMMELNKITLDISPLFEQQPQRCSVDQRFLLLSRKSSSFAADDGSETSCLILPHNWSYGFRTNWPLQETMERLFRVCKRLEFVSDMKNMRKLYNFHYRFKTKQGIRFDIQIYSVRDI